MVSVQTLSLQRQVLIKPQAFRAPQHQKSCTSSFAYLPLGGGRAAFSTTRSCQGPGLKEEPRSRLRLRRRLVTFLPSVLRLPAMVMSARASTSEALAADDRHHELEVRHKDLLVVGPGVLGSLIAQQWFQSHPDATVVGQTNTTNSHERLKSIGVRPVVKDLDDDSPQKFPYVVFSAPPSGSQDYAGEVRAAAERWDGTGALLFTSSTGVFPQDDGSFVDETSPCVELGASPRLDKLLNAEAEVLKVGGNVVRLAGLYLFDRGAHTFWVTRETVPGNPDSFVNLIHYEDAASIAVAILNAKPRGETFVGCDNHPVTRQEIMDITLKSGHFKGPFKGFAGGDDSLGKRIHNDLTRAKLGWQPRYHSFADFIQQYQPEKAEAKA